MEAIRQHSAAAARKVAHDITDKVNVADQVSAGESGMTEDQDAGLVLAYETNEDGLESATEISDTTNHIQDALQQEDLAETTDAAADLAKSGQEADSDEPEPDKNANEADPDKVVAATGTTGKPREAEQAKSQDAPDAKQNHTDTQNSDFSTPAQEDAGSGADALAGTRESDQVIIDTKVPDTDTADDTADKAAHSASDLPGREEEPSNTEKSDTKEKAADTEGQEEPEGLDLSVPSGGEAAEAGHAQSSRKKHIRLKPWRLLTKTAKIVAIVIVCLIVAGFGFFHYEYSRLQKVDPDAYTDDKVIENVAKDATDEVLQQAVDAMEDQTEDLEETEVVQAEGDIFEDSDVYNILLIGTDDRTEKFSAEARGDSCLLLSLNKKTGKVNLLSFERGMGVPILWGPYQGEWDWLTHTFRYGGAEMMVEEIRDNFKVDVNKYIRINIRTLVKIIDAMGGIDIELTEAEANHLNHPEGTFTEGYAKGIGKEDELQKDLVAGMNHLNGTTAMVLARTRAIDDDWHRVERQRRVIVAAQKKLNSLNAVQLAATLDAIVPLINTNLTETEVADLITLAPDFLGADVNQQTIPAEGTYGSMHGMDNRPCFAVDFAANAKLIRELLYGEEAAAEIGATTDDEEANNAREAYSQNKGESTSSSYSSGSSYSSYSSGSSYSGGSTSSGSTSSGNYSSSGTQSQQTTSAGQNLPDVVSQVQDSTQTESGVAADGTVLTQDGTGVTGTDGAAALTDGTVGTGAAADGTGQVVDPATGTLVQQGTDAASQAAGAAVGQAGTGADANTAAGTAVQDNAAAATTGTSTDAAAAQQQAAAAQAAAQQQAAAAQAAAVAQQQAAAAAAAQQQAEAAAQAAAGAAGQQTDAGSAADSGMGGAMGQGAYAE